VVKQDKDGNENLYGERVDPKRVLEQGAYAVPPEAKGFVEALENASPRQKAGS
jgi:lipid-binding SYLF domain-containing protein